MRPCCFRCGRRCKLYSICAPPPPIDARGELRVDFCRPGAVLALPDRRHHSNWTGIRAYRPASLNWTMAHLSLSHRARGVWSWYGMFFSWSVRKPAGRSGNRGFSGRLIVRALGYSRGLCSGCIRMCDMGPGGTRNPEVCRRARPADRCRLNRNQKWPAAVGLPGSVGRGAGYGRPVLAQMRRRYVRGPSNTN